MRAFERNTPAIVPPVPTPLTPEPYSQFSPFTLLQGKTVFNPEHGTYNERPNYTQTQTHEISISPLPN